jgi:hypothetical protein
MSNLVFVLDTEKRPLLPVHPGKARRLLNAPKAAVFRRDPFTIILKVVVTATPESITLKIDPGSQTTGIALVQGEKVVVGAELTHRGQSLKTTLESRSSVASLTNKSSHTIPPSKVLESHPSEGLVSTILATSGRKNSNLGQKIAPTCTYRFNSVQSFKSLSDLTYNN